MAPSRTVRTIASAVIPSTSSAVFAPVSAAEKPRIPAPPVVWYPSEYSKTAGFSPPFNVRSSAEADPPTIPAIMPNAIASGSPSLGAGKAARR